MIDLSAYRPNVGVVLFHPDGRVWLGRRAKTPGPYNWQFPQGGADEGEDLEAAAIRELHEETGARSITHLGRTEGWLTYDFPPEHTGSKIARGWRGRAGLVRPAIRGPGHRDRPDRARPPGVRRLALGAPKKPPAWWCRSNARPMRPLWRRFAPSPARRAERHRALLSFVL